MPWIRVDLTHEEIIKGRHTLLEQAFDKVLMQAMGSEHVALFRSKDFLTYPTPYYIHVPQDLVDTLRPIWLVRSFDGQDCDPPSRDQILLVAGSPRAWDLLLEKSKP